MLHRVCVERLNIVIFDKSEYTQCLELLHSHYLKHLIESVFEPL